MEVGLMSQIESPSPRPTDRLFYAAVAVIGYGLWQRRYAGNPQLIGQTLTLDGKTYTVIGILPPWLKQPGLTVPSLQPAGADVWIPVVPAASEQNRSFANMRVIARLKPEVTLARAQAEMDAITGRLERQYPDINANVGADVSLIFLFQTAQSVWLYLVIT